MTSAFIPKDDAARRRIRKSLGETLFVEAGAGTGKTTSLVDRVVELVASGEATLDRIAAITFTEAAAAELRDRIRDELEKAAASSEPAEERRALCRRGVEDLDMASIQTLHSFAGAILREKPIEAGLPPAFETMDEVSGGLAFDEAWTEWLDAQLEGDTPLAEPLSTAFSLGLSTDNIREIAKRFNDNYDLIEDARFADVPAPGESAVSRIADSADELERLCDYSDLGEADTLFVHVQGKLSAMRATRGVEPLSSEACRALARLMPLKQGRGRQSDWGVDTESGMNACKLMKDTLSELHAAAEEELALARLSAFMPILRALRDFTLEYSRDRKRRGRATFQDLLVWARDLLRDDLPTRDHFRRRFSRLLIDEAQDTDPIQAEIAMFLAEDAPEGTPDADRPRDWLDVTPERGKLFVVGDPKQSIYRFRRADVRQMEALRERMGGATLNLTQNFRSQRPVLDWVNPLFHGWMGEGSESQASYVPIVHRWTAATDHEARPRVWSLGDVVDAKVDAMRREETRDIAALLSRIVGDGWRILDTEATASSGKEAYKQAEYSDICILMPTRTALRTLEQALEDADVPYRLEGASLVLASQEVRDLLNCLRAVDDPSDEVAVVAALRSPAFGCADTELLRFRDAGGGFDYLSRGKSVGGVVGESLAALREYHESRTWTSITALIERFVRERSLMQAALDSARTREQWRRYRFIVERARAFSEAGGGSLRSFLAWMQDQVENDARVSESPAPEGDENAVRIMTVHGAKGLEFPVVVLTGLNSPGSHPVGNVLFDRENGGVEVRTGNADNRFQTDGYEDLSEYEKAMDTDERARLLYVAATRARDHLVVSVYRTQRSQSSPAGKIAEFMQGRDDLWEALPSPVLRGDAPGRSDETGGAGDVLTEEHTLESRRRWIAERRALVERRGRPSSVAATTLARVEKEEAESEEPWRRGRGGSSVGRAVHAVLQSIDLNSGAGIEETARAQARAEGIPLRADEIAELARAAVGSGIARRAVASGRFWREVPVAAPVGDGALEGFIDLLFEEDDGLVVVDYKTDAVGAEDTADAARGYELQAGAYALAIERAVGRPVKEIVFLFLRPAREEVFTDVARLSRRAESRALEALGS